MHQCQTGRCWTEGRSQDCGDFAIDLDSSCIYERVSRARSYGRSGQFILECSLLRYSASSLASATAILR